MNIDHSLWTPRIAILGMSLALAAVCPVRAQVQAKPQAAPAPPLELKVFQSHQRPATNLVETFRQLYWDRVGKEMQMVGDPTSANRIFVRGRPDDIKLLETFIRDADLPIERSASVGMVRVFPLKHLEPDAALQRVAKMVTDSSAGASSAIDPQRKLLVVRSSDEAVFQRMEKVLHDLDVPVATTPERHVRVRIVWLVTGPQNTKTATPPPPDLKDVITELAGVGFDKPRTIGQMVVNVMVNQRFEAVGTADLQGEEGMTWKTQGTVKKSSGDTLKLNIELRANPRFVNGEATSTSVPLFDIITEITTKPGHSVVLAMTPSGSLTSAFVVQVLPRPEPEATKP
jgi:hypothetical protein